jgi:hypothetical protein
MWIISMYDKKTCGFTDTYIYIIIYIYNDNEPHGIRDYTHYFQRTPSTQVCQVWSRSSLISLSRTKGKIIGILRGVQALKPISNDFFWVRVLLYWTTFFHGRERETVSPSLKDAGYLFACPSFLFLDTFLVEETQGHRGEQPKKDRTPQQVARTTRTITITQEQSRLQTCRTIAGGRFGTKRQRERHIILKFHTDPRQSI